MLNSLGRSFSWLASMNMKRIVEAENMYHQEEYLDCIQDSLTFGRFNSSLRIHYVETIAMATGLLMIGVPSINTDDVRDRLRT